jgi:hypothetical protein
MRDLASVGFTCRRSTSQSNGHSSTGSASWSRRRPRPIETAAITGSAIHRESAAEQPGMPSVTSQAPSAPLPCASTRGTATRPSAHLSRSASPGRSISGVPLAVHLT